MTPVRLTILGSGTSQGVPTIGCSCDTCTSDDPRDSRLRPSALFTVGETHLLIDTSSDFRQQALRYNMLKLNAVLYTHHHFDHIGGFDDIRTYNFLQHKPMNIYGTERTLSELRTTFRYAFGAAEQEGGGVPQVETRPLPDSAGEMLIEGVTVVTLPVMHGKLPILGFRIGPVAYVTDASMIPDESLALLKGLDALVLNALRFKEHPTHYNLDQAVEMAQKIGAKQTYFTHIAHNIKHARDSEQLPEGMAFAYDGLVIESNGSAL